MDGSLSRRGFIAGAAVAGGLRPSALTAALPADARLAPSDMRADIALLRRGYGLLHPGLLRYRTAAQIDADFASLNAAAARPMTLGAFYLLLSRLLGGIRCGHSYLNFYNQSKAIQASLYQAPTRLPVQFLWLGSRMIVTADPFGTGIAPGSEIVAINGRPAAAVLAAMMPYARADGHNDAKRRRLLSVQGEDGYETFDIFHDLLFGGRDRHDLVVLAPDGRRRTARVAAATLAQRRTQQAIPDRGRDDGPIWSIEPRGRAALLTMNGWGLYNSRWDWRGWLDAAIDRLVAERTPALIVDLRRNEGGEDCGDALVARLIERPLIADPARRLVRYRELPADLRPYCDTWDRSFNRLGVGATPVDDRFLALAGTTRDATVIAPKGPRYTGRVVVLVGPQNSSATFAFAQMIARERLGTLVGAPTGGNRRGINGGCFYFFRLPATGLEADLPLIGTFPLTPQPDGGVAPDIPVPLTATAIARGSDPVLERAMDLVA